MPVAVRLIVSGRACVNVFLRTGALVGFRIKSGGDFAAAFVDTVFEVGCCRGSYFRAAWHCVCACLKAAAHGVFLHASMCSVCFSGVFIK